MSDNEQETDRGLLKKDDWWEGKKFCFEFSNVIFTFFLETNDVNYWKEGKEILFEFFVKWNFSIHEWNTDRKLLKKERKKRKYWELTLLFIKNDIDFYEKFMCDKILLKIE